MKRNQPMYETKAQRWRALARLKSGEEALVCLGSSTIQVKEYYGLPWFDELFDAIRDDVVDIVLQKWNGLPDRGNWVTQNTLPFPRPRLHLAS